MPVSSQSDSQKALIERERQELADEPEDGQLELTAISTAVEAFYAGDPAPAMSVPVLQKSGPFRAHAWDVLRTVCPGAPVTYTEYASLSGNPKAVRAAASAGAVMVRLCR